jgi:hypothetical protein
MSGKKYLPVYFYAGILLLMFSWYFNWHLDGLRTHYLFFPLWFGYCLLVDGIVFKRTGSSLIYRGWKKYLFLFIISIPVWWLFEGLNLRTQNWLYLGREYFSDLEYFLYASLCFSTVIPAVFESAELVHSFHRIKKLKDGPRISSNRNNIKTIMGTGFVSLVLLLIWPEYFYIFLWLSVFLILDSINYIRGRRSLVFYTDKKDWRLLVSLALGCLMCGFFWEMWNYYAYPKWIYHTPGVEFLYVFEMPALGYLGYIPFSFELFAFYHMLTVKRSEKDTPYYIFHES